MTVFTRTHLHVDGESAKAATVNVREGGWVSVELNDGDSGWALSGTATNLTDFLLAISDRVPEQTEGVTP